MDWEIRAPVLDRCYGARSDAMSIRKGSAFLIAAVATVLSLACLTGLEEARGALIIFKDGFTVSGEIREPRKLQIDSGISYSMPEGLIYVDDGARRIVFPATNRQVADVLKDDPADKDRMMILRKTGRGKAP